MDSAQGSYMAPLFGDLTNEMHFLKKKLLIFPLDTLYAQACQKHVFHF